MSTRVDEEAQPSDAADGADHSPEPGPAEATVVVAAGGSVVEREPAAARGGLRADFGAHLEAHYPRLVGQLFAITLDNRAAHDLVQDAYSRAWRRWSEIRAGDAEAWVRRVAVRSSANPWRRFAAGLGMRGTRMPQQETLDPRIAAVLRALQRVPLDERRAAVLVHMAGLSVAEVAGLEKVSQGTVAARLSRVGTQVVEALAGYDPGPEALLDHGHEQDHTHDSEEER